MGRYAIYLTFTGRMAGPERRMKVYAGGTASKNEAIRLAREIIFREEGGHVEVVEVVERIDQNGCGNALVYRMSHKQAPRFTPDMDGRAESATELP